MLARGWPVFPMLFAEKQDDTTSEINMNDFPFKKSPFFPCLGRCVFHTLPWFLQVMICISSTCSCTLRNKVYTVGSSTEELGMYFSGSWIIRRISARNEPTLSVLAYISMTGYHIIRLIYLCIFCVFDLRLSCYAPRYNVGYLLAPRRKQDEKNLFSLSKQQKCFPTHQKGSESFYGKKFCEKRNNVYINKGFEKVTSLNLTFGEVRTFVRGIFLGEKRDWCIHFLCAFKFLKKSASSFMKVADLSYGKL